MGKYYLSPRWSGEIADCSMPLTFDQYSTCGFTCLYCFSFYQRAYLSSYRKESFTGVDIDDFKRLFSLEKENNPMTDYIAMRKTLQWGGLSDPFCPIERRHGLGLQILEFLYKIRYEVCFSTKSTWWTEDDRYISFFKDTPFFNVKFSIVMSDMNAAKAIERGVPSPDERFEAMERIAKICPGGVTLRLRPILPGVTTRARDYLKLIQKAYNAGASAVSTEFFCLDARRLRPEFLKTLSHFAGFDYLRYYKIHSRARGYLRLNSKIKYPIFKEMKALCKRLGMRFYVSDAHCKWMCDNGSCCGLSEQWNYVRAQQTEGLLIAKRKGIVHWSDIYSEERAPYLYRVMTSDMFHLNGITGGNWRKRVYSKHKRLVDILRYNWNNLRAGQGFYRYFDKACTPIGLDENRNRIFKYNIKVKDG